MPPYHWLRHHRRAQKNHIYIYIYIALAKHWGTPWGWFLCEPKHIEVFIVTLILFRVGTTSNAHQLDFNKRILILKMHGTNIKKIIIINKKNKKIVLHKFCLKPLFLCYVLRDCASDVSQTVCRSSCTMFIFVVWFNQNWSV
jgi:hypothetical protein